jgi:hypothetical protein
MTARHPARHLLVASLLGVAALAGCSSGSDDEATTTTASAESEGGGEETPTTEAEAPEVDPAGAEEVGAVAEAMLTDMRESAETVDGSSTNDEVVAQLRELRNIAFEADAEVREVEVADPDLAGLVNDLIVTIGESISAYDAVTTDPASAGPDELTAVNEGSLALVSAGSALQDGAAAVAAGEPVPDGPTLFEVLPLPEDVAEAAGGSGPEWSAFLDAPVLTTENGPCSEPSPFLVAPPRAYADLALSDPTFVGTFRVLSFADDAEAASYLAAVEAFYGCDQPEIGAIEFETEEGQAFASVEVDGYVTSVLVQQVGSRVHAAVLEADQLDDPAEAAELGRERVEGLMEVSLEKAGA